MEYPPADDELVHQRLNRLASLWATLASVHEGQRTADVTDRLEFLRRYQRAVYHFLLQVAAEADAADELFQEGVVRFVRGDSRQLDPQEALPREYLASILAELVGDQDHATAAGDAATIGSPPDAGWAQGPPDYSDEFLDCWRAEMLARTWERLATEEQLGGPPLYSVLRYRAEHPGEGSSEAALEITLRKGLQPALSSRDLRALLQRARQQYASFLVDEVARSLPEPDRGGLERELRELDLLRFCRGALERRQG
jgi:DNA-directed RNA polymerase specialized sigma24 family protein